MSEPKTLIEVKNATRILEGEVPVTLIKDIDMAVREKEFVAITGPSGSGKSSLLYLLGLLDRPTSGEVWVEGRDTAQLNDNELAELRLERLGFIFQFHFLLPEFSILENVLIPMRRLGVLSEKEMHQRGEKILHGLGLADHIHKHPNQVSGGQMQRVAVARALANDPPIILADEPTGSLDTTNAAMVFDIFRELVEQGGRTVISVTHEPELADKTDRIVRLVDGKIESDRQTKKKTARRKANA